MENESYYQITYYGYGMTALHDILPQDTTEEKAIEIARTYAKDPHRGFSSLKKIMVIKV